MMATNQSKKENIEETDVESEEIQKAEESQSVEEIVEEKESDEQMNENDEILALREELAEVKALAEEYKDGWQRARAEFANYRKRVDRERSEIYQQAAAEIIKRYLDIADDLARALENRPTEGEGASWADGIEMIYQKLLKIMENEGVSLMDLDGKTFDPNQHEAISLEDSPHHESGEIIEVVKPGYLLGDRVLRPATVRVAS